MRLVGAALCGLTLLSACSPGTDVPKADTAVGRFHQQLNGGQFSVIYDEAAPAFKTATKADDLTTLLSAVHRKLGAYQSGSSVGWNDNMATGGHFVTVTWQSKFERGEATENFVYLIYDEQASLVGYHVNSNALIVN